ncbi:hypothetical protein [Ferroplasma sp.]|uniref:hypothetical protein n=1 Tax=Ferroplasma sp. TaxID=2591003 RepID=UPI00307D8026
MIRLLRAEYPQIVGNLSLWTELPILYPLAGRGNSASKLVEAGSPRSLGIEGHKYPVLYDNLEEAGISKNTV